MSEIGPGPFSCSATVLLEKEGGDAALLLKDYKSFSIKNIRLNLNYKSLNQE